MNYDDLISMKDSGNFDVHELRGPPPDPSRPLPIPADQPDSTCERCSEPGLFYAFIDEVHSSTGQSMGLVGVALCYRHTAERFGTKALMNIGKVPKLTEELRSKYLAEALTNPLPAHPSGPLPTIEPSPAAQFMETGDKQGFINSIINFFKEAVAHPERVPPSVHKVLSYNLTNHPEKIEAVSKALLDLLTSTDPS